MTLSLREQNKRKCRAKILWAARRLFNSKGYDDTMITDVANKAMISKATLYNYFPNKESLLLGIAEEEVELLRKMVEGDLKGESDAEKRIRHVMEVYIMDSVSYLSLARRISFLYADEGLSQDNPHLRMSQLLLEMVEEARQQNVFREDAVAAEVVEVLMGVYYTALYGWPGIRDCPAEECRARIARNLDLVLEGVYHPSRRKNG